MQQHSDHALSVGAYTEANVKMAGMHEDFVMGFISMTPAKWDWGPGSPGLSSSSRCFIRLSAKQVFLFMDIFFPLSYPCSFHQCGAQVVVMVLSIGVAGLVLAQTADVLQQCEQSRDRQVCNRPLHIPEGRSS